MAQNQQTGGVGPPVVLSDAITLLGQNTVAITAEQASNQTAVDTRISIRGVDITNDSKEVIFITIKYVDSNTAGVKYPDTPLWILASDFGKLTPLRAGVANPTINQIYEPTITTSGVARSTNDTITVQTGNRAKTLRLTVYHIKPGG